jgi:hypothetical protein
MKTFYINVRGIDLVVTDYCLEVSPETAHRGWIENSTVKTQDYDTGGIVVDHFELQRVVVDDTRTKEIDPDRCPRFFEEIQREMISQLENGMQTF